jgi:hypothetical protein
MDSNNENNEKEGDHAFLLLTLTQGEWGERIAEHIQQTAPSHWVVNTWKAPRVLPPIIDYPEDFLPESLPQASVVLSLGDTSGLAQLVPDVAAMSGAKAVIAPIDNNESLPPGLARQLNQWLENINVESVFPKPFCSLTETTYNQKPLVTPYDIELVREFARYYGRPEFNIVVEDGRISEAEITRDAACGCARAVADGLVGIEVDNAVDKTGMLHHHFPCLASMNQDADYHDTLMHVSGHIIQDSVKEEIKEYLSPTPYLRPEGHVEEATNFTTDGEPEDD